MGYEEFEENERKSWLLAGFCCYCGKAHVFKMYRPKVDQKLLNNKAFFKCDCEDAVQNRKEREELKRILEAQGRYELAKQLG